MKAQSAAPGTTVAMLDNLMMATSTPSKKTSIIPQGRSTCMARTSTANPGARFAWPSGTSNQARMQSCSSGKSSVVASTSRATSDMPS